MTKKVSGMKPGERGLVKKIEGGLRERVAGMGIRVGKVLEMAAKQPMRGPVVVVIDGSTISLGMEIAERIVVEVER